MKLWLAPGASGNAASVAGAVAGLRRRGVEAEAIDVPQGRVERAAQRFLELARPEDVVAGQSYGGRAASLAAAEAPARPSRLASFAGLSPSLTTATLPNKHGLIPRP